MDYEVTNPNMNGDRLTNAAVEILRQVEGHALGITVLCKALFYLDLLHLLDQGETITGSDYIALRRGPVVADYETRLVDKLKARGLALQSSRGEWQPVVLVDPSSVPMQPYKNLARKIVRSIGRFIAIRSSDYSHRNPGWQRAWAEGGEGESARFIDMSLALQQLAGNDDWLDAPLTGAEWTSVLDADASAGDPW